MFLTTIVGRAGQMLRQVARDGARVGIVGAAGIEADDQVDGAAFVELLDGLRVRLRAAEQSAQRQQHERNSQRA